MDIPTLTGTGEEQLRQLVAYIDQAITRKQWSNEDYQRKTARRTAHQILHDRDTGYMGSCYDLTLASAAVLLANHQTPTLITEEVENRRYGYLLHFALEIYGQFLEYASCNTVYMGQG